MQIAQGLDQFSDIDSLPILGKPLFRSQVCKQLASIQIVNYEVQLSISLKGVVQTDYVRTLRLLKDDSLSNRRH